MDTIEYNSSEKTYKSGWRFKDEKYFIDSLSTFLILDIFFKNILNFEKLSIVVLITNCLVFE